QKSGLIFFGCALIYAAIVGMHGVFLISVFMATNYLYSAYPFCLKRVPVLSKCVIAINSLILMLLGFWLVTGNISDFPKPLYLIVLVLLTLAANVVDLNQAEAMTLSL